MNHVQGSGQADETVHLQAEFPETGTSLNPVEEPWWGFEHHSDASTDSPPGRT